MRTRIKICGIRDVDSAIAAAEAGADAIGLVFAKQSPRFVEPDDAFDIMSALPPFVSSVGVFRDHSVDEFADIEELCPTLYSQLHGSEDVRTVKACGPDVIKAIAFDENTIQAELFKWAALDEVCAILIDASTPGAGEAFDWKKLEPFVDTVTTPVIIAGGLTPENVGECIRVLRPWGVDVSSGVERERGVKDEALMQAFCDAVREADGS
ncbi:MAG TPA: phosphoribosylanthranilate isomerase [Phycisphaerales bacterium]|nr:phosphoribosylanthranilate isomerase [Phycisphaerales bacterium]